MPECLLIASELDIVFFACQNLVLLDDLLPIDVGAQLRVICNSDLRSCVDFTLWALSRALQRAGLAYCFAGFYGHYSDGDVLSGHGLVGDCMKLCIICQFRERAAQTSASTDVHLLSHRLSYGRKGSWCRDAASTSCR